MKKKNFNFMFTLITLGYFFIFGLSLIFLGVYGFVVAIGLGQLISILFTLFLINGKIEK